MRKNEGKGSLKNMQTTRSNIPKNILDNSQLNSNIAFDLEFISYINELSSSIKKFYKSSSQNFNQIKAIINHSDSSNKEKEIKDNQNNNNLIFSFHELENFFSDFYTKAKNIFKNMKNYHNQFTQNSLNTTSRKNENLKKNERICSLDTNKKNPNIKIPTTPPKKNIIKKIPKAMVITEENININNKYNNNTVTNLSVSNYNKINFSVGASPSIPNLFQFEERILFLEKECEKYKKNLFDFSNEVNKFLINLNQFQNKYIINIPENLRNKFENEKNELNNICLNYISNIQNEMSNSI